MTGLVELVQDESQAWYTECIQVRCPRHESHQWTGATNLAMIDTKDS